MKVIIANSSERFDNISFSNVTDDGKSLSIFSNYTCPKCKENIVFKKNDFVERSLKDFSNLSIEHQTLFNASANDNQFNNFHFLDWYCPKCNLPVRVYVEHWVGGRHGDSGVNLKSVLELF